MASIINCTISVLYSEKISYILNLHYLFAISDYLLMIERDTHTEYQQLCKEHQQPTTLFCPHCCQFICPLCPDNHTNSGDILHAYQIEQISTIMHQQRLNTTLTSTYDTLITLFQSAITQVSEAFYRAIAPLKPLPEAHLDSILLRMNQLPAQAVEFISQATIVTCTTKAVMKRRRDYSFQAVQHAKELINLVQHLSSGYFQDEAKIRNDVALCHRLMQSLVPTITHTQELNIVCDKNVAYSSPAFMKPCSLNQPSIKGSFSTLPNKCKEKMSYNKSLPITPGVQNEPSIKIFGCKPLKAVEIQGKWNILMKLEAPKQVENPKKEEPKAVPIIAPVQPIVVAPVKPMVVAPIQQIDPMLEK